MSFHRLSFMLLVYLTVTACASITGPATDPFDEDEGEGSIDLIETIQPLVSTSEEKISPSEESSNNLVDLDPDEFRQFQEWKRARDNNSAEYLEFKEYLEYKKWLETQKKN